MTTKNQPQTVAPIDNKQTATDYITKMRANARKIAKHVAKRDDELAKVNAKYDSLIEPLQTLNTQLKSAVESWCQDNKSKLLTGNSKTFSLAGVDISWRIGKPSVIGTATPELIARLERFGLDRFVRVKKELDKTAILKEPKAIDGIDGLGIEPAKEEIVIRFD